jgi:hypothetical protein
MRVAGHLQHMGGRKDKKFIQNFSSELEGKRPLRRHSIQLKWGFSEWGKESQNYIQFERFLDHLSFSRTILSHKFRVRLVITKNNNVKRTD